MTRRLVQSIASLVLLAVPALPAGAQPALTVVAAGPTGEIASLPEANEIRVTFSESMVTLGKIPDPVTAPFFSIRPAVAGTFRWSGTTILVLTPDPSRRLPYATRFEVTIAASATALSGRRLAAPHTFSFTTPTVRLLSTEWYRDNGRYDGTLKVALRFNQPVRPADVGGHAAFRFERHPFQPPAALPAALARMQASDPTSWVRYQAKLSEAARVAGLAMPLSARVAADWDTERLPAAPDLVVLDVTDTVPPESWVRLELDETLPSPAGPGTPGKPQVYTIRVEPAFFVDAFSCRTACDPEQRNPFLLRRDVDLTRLRGAVRVTDVTEPSREAIVRPSRSPVDVRSRYQYDRITHASLEDAGYDAQPPARTYLVRVDAGLQANDGQTLGFTWYDSVENWHQRAFTSFGDGHGVWETGGGLLLPFSSRNFLDVTQWASPLGRDALMPTVLALQRSGFRGVPDGEGVHRDLRVTPDTIQAHGLDLRKAIGPAGHGLVVAGVRNGRPVEHARTSGPAERSTIVQVTNLGITVKDSPQNTLVLVTRLDTGDPVPGATVSIIQTDNSVFWTGLTGLDGVAVAPDTRLRPVSRWWEFSFLVIAEKDGDLAYVGSNWNEGVQPWYFGSAFDPSEGQPLLRGTVFTDRGVYRLGEEVHFKSILRRDAPTGIDLLPAGTPVRIVLRDSRDREIDRRTVTMSEWSSSEWTFTLPADGALGTYRVQTAIEAPGSAAKPEEGAEPSDRGFERAVVGSFLVAAYRRPAFRVDATLAADPAVAGATLHGEVSAAYLFGASMRNRPVSWRAYRTPLCRPPVAVTERFTESRYVFVGWCDQSGQADLAREEASLDAGGRLSASLQTAPGDEVPYLYTFEGDVEDVSRQRIAGRASLVVHPAPWYVGLQRPPFFVEAARGLDTTVVAAALDGAPVPGVSVEVSLTETQWHSVRRAEGHGFYTWETERQEVPAGSWSVTTAAEPVPLAVPIRNGGYFTLVATARDDEGHVSTTRTSFYALGAGYTAWARYDHNRIDLVPERQTYKPGDTARLMVQSPWETATALVTTEREGVRSHRTFALTSTQQTVEVPIAETDIPNVFVSVLLVKGRTRAGATDDTGDPGKPSFRLGYAELKVEDASRRLGVRVTANQEEYRPAKNAHVDLEVTDAQHQPAASEVTVWAVDYGVLSLTAFRTPDVLESVYVRKALEVLTEDSRQRIVSRRVLVPKGGEEGGGGGGDAGANAGIRKDFRVLAFWLGSVVTDDRGRAGLDVTLPESLTTYRIMAVAGDRQSRFGGGESEIRVNKPVTLSPAFPRFMAVGDRASFGSVVTSQLAAAGPAVVTMRSLDPDVLEVQGDARHTVTIAAGGSAEVRFDTVARKVGRARVRITVQLNAEDDAFEDVVPVEVLSSPETVAAYGEARPDAAERLEVPTGVVPGFGGLHLELSSTAMTGLGEGARYLVEYPYGCAEQVGSRALALALAADLGGAFRLPGIEAQDLAPTVQTALASLEKFQCANGGFAYWPGECRWTSPYLTAYLLHVLQVASSEGYGVGSDVIGRALDYLQRALAEPPPANEGWWPQYTAWQAFAVKVLVEGGRNQDSDITRLYGYRDRMPVFGLAYLQDAMAARGESGQRRDDLRRRLMNAILPEGGSAHVEELTDPYLLWFWNSNVRSTAIALKSLMQAGDADALVRPLVRWLLVSRKNGRWGNTQENALAMEALVAYYRKYEAEVPDFRAVVRLGRDELARERFEGRSTEAVVRELPMAELAVKVPPGASRRLTFTRDGTGTLFYAARLRYARDILHQEGFDAGFALARRYAPYVEAGGAEPAPALTYEAGDLVRVTLSLDLTKERRFVVVTDPLPAGFEPVESWFATTAAGLASAQQEEEEAQGGWRQWWERGGFDHVERHDDRVLLFATRLSEGHHEFSYVVRATTAGTFRTAPAHVEEMYEPEVFGRTATVTIDVRR
jgi:uncharacterized protein YfaS (alpha-2-macroglobulin family)